MKTKDKPILHFNVQLTALNPEGGNMGLAVRANTMRVTAGNALVFQVDGYDVMALNSSEWLKASVMSEPEAPSKEDVAAAIEKFRANGATSTTIQQVEASMSHPNGV